MTLAPAAVPHYEASPQSLLILDPPHQIIQELLPKSISRASRLSLPLELHCIHSSVPRGPNLSCIAKYKVHQRSPKLSCAHFNNNSPLKTISRHNLHFVLVHNKLLHHVKETTNLTLDASCIFVGKEIKKPSLLRSAVLFDYVYQCT